jgi:hypothetical protein
MSDTLKLAKEIADSILEMTKALVLTGEEDREEQEVDDYIALLDNREPLVEQLAELQPAIDSEMKNSAEFAEIKKTIAQITALDEVHLEFMRHKHKQVQGSYKEIKLGQRIHAGYNPLPGNEVSSKFDIKQ